VKLTTHLHLVPRSRMSGVIPPLPQYASMVWCSVKKAQGQLYLYLKAWRLILRFTHFTIYSRNSFSRSVNSFPVTSHRWESNLKLQNRGGNQCSTTFNVSSLTHPFRILEFQVTIHLTRSIRDVHSFIQVKITNESQRPRTIYVLLTSFP
jgi:hypothetical protein